MRFLIAVSAICALGACGDPIATFPRLSDTDLDTDAAPLSVSTAPEKAENDQPQTGFFARLLRVENNESPTEMHAVDTETEEVHVASPPETCGATSDLKPENEEKSGFWDLFSKSSSVSPNTLDISHGDYLPYGQLARACDLPKRAMGKKVAQFPERRPRHTLYDTDPGNTAPHTFYLTGFADGCARQFTASLAIFGTVGMHEQIRYGLPSQVQPYSNTDKSYEKLKSRVCGVPRKKPCGSNLSRLENNTVFLSIYESFGGIEQWSNLLIHDGRVLAQDVKG